MPLPEEGFLCLETALEARNGFLTSLQGGEKTVFFDKKQTNMFFSKNTVFFMFFMFFIFFLISTMNLVKNNA